MTFRVRGIQMKEYNSLMRILYSLFFAVIFAFLFPVKAFSLELSFFNTNIKEALNMLSLDTGVVIVYEPSISGSITLQVQAETLEEILDLLLMPYSYYWAKVGDVYFVGNNNPGSTGFINTAQVYQIPLKYNSSRKILDVIPKSLQDYVMKPVEDNSLLVYAPPSIASKIASFISHIDIPNVSKEVYVKVIDVSEQFLKSHMPEISISSASMYAPNLLQIPLLNTNVNILLNMEENKTDLEILYEGKLKALSGYSSKITTQRNYTTQRYVDGKFTTLQNQATVEMIITPSFLYKSCLIDVSFKIDGIPSSMEINLETKGTSLNSTLNVDYNKTYIIGSFTYDKAIEKEGGVGFLKDLPFVGWLFKKNYTEFEKRYVIFMLSVSSQDTFGSLKGDEK